MGGKRKALTKILLLMLITEIFSSTVIKANGEDRYKATGGGNDAEVCEKELTTSFATAYRAGKTTAAALNYTYNKMGAEERKVMRNAFLTSKGRMATTGVAVISSTKPELRQRVNCYLSAYENLNTGFISGFSESLIPELKKIYIGVPLL